MKAKERAEDLIHSKAAEWVVRLEVPQDEATHAEFRKWISADLRHRAAFNHAQTSWEAIGRLSGAGEARELFPAEWFDTARTQGLSDSAVGSKRPWQWVVARAASVVLAVLGAVVWVIWGVSGPNNEAPVVQEAIYYETGIGERERIVLSDDSVLTINADSLLSVVFDDRQRLVVLHSGEALFEVAADPSRPFAVYVNGGTVTAIGTAYNIRYRGDRADVTVMEGQVNLQFSAEAEQAAGTNQSLRGTTIREGQAVSYDRGTIDLRELNRRSLDRVVAWQTGRLYFDEATLATIVEEISHHVPERIVIADDEVSAYVGGGLFFVEDVDSVLRALEVAWPISVTRSEPGVVVIGRKETDSRGAAGNP